MCDKQRQLDEIEVLESIYDKDLIVASRWPSRGCLSISPDPPSDEISMHVINVVNEQSVAETIKLKYLAPIEMYFECPVDYPSKSQPRFILKCIWLSEQSLSDICRNLDAIWDRTRSEILYEWAYSLKDCCSFLKIAELRFTTNVNESHAIESCATDLRLIALKNKVLEGDEDQRESSICETASLHRKKYRRTRGHKLRGNFKYETPKDTKTNANDQSCDVEDNSLNSEPSLSHSSTSVEFLLSLLAKYGVRRKTLFKDCDSRVVPNYEETKADAYGTRGVSLIVQKMIDFNDECVSKAFRHESHFCGICLEAKQGSECVRIRLCGHIFCRECFSQYLSINIANGNLRALRCPDIDCGTSITVAQIRESVDETTFRKFEQFSLQMTVEDDPNLLYCPRDVCQSVARLCPQLGADICFCSRCSFYFCAWCKKAYHGVQPCDLLNEARSKVVREYLEADSARREELEKRYTKQQISKWVNDHLTSKYIEETSRPCPNCGVPIQKNDGCNKMLCSKCNIPFCWLCNKCLSTVTPYNHFTDKDSPCYQKLFNLTAEERELDGDENEDFWVQLFF